MNSRLLLLALMILACSTMAWAQETAVSVDDLPCVGLEPDSPNNHAIVRASVNPESPGSSVRVYMRRMHIEVEDFYWEEMVADGGGDYWGVTMDPEDRRPVRKKLDDDDDTETEWADWWKAKEASDDRDPNGDLDADVIRERAQVGKLEKRTWMDALTNQQLQDWLEELENEPVEYYAAVYNPDGSLAGKSEMKVAPVVEDCRFNPTAQQLGWSLNQTVGETAFWQKGEIPFHWECDHIVSRYDAQDVLRADEVCRACVVAAIAGWVPAAIVGAGVVGAILISDDAAPPASPSVP